LLIQQVESTNLTSDITSTNNLLSFVPTPIGNLGDITLRSLEVISSAKTVFCEDTRVTKSLFKLLSERYSELFRDFKRDFISLHSHNEKRVLENLNLDIFQENSIYVSDAGLPGVSDPGIELLRFARDKNIEFQVLPGATASTIAHLLSGFSEKEFLFYGFLPHKGNSRKSELEKTIWSGYSVIFYESPHRLQKLLLELSEITPHRQIFVGKELTKKYENRWWGTSKEIQKEFQAINVKGEWVVVVEGENRFSGGIVLEDIEKLDIPPKEKAKLISKVTGEKVKDIYNRLI
jgi:16S rRNA (cytidine1402-2'-O)-methyltransferase